MYHSIQKQRNKLIVRFFSALICLCFVFTTVLPPAQAQVMLNLPLPGTMVMPSAAYSPAVMIGMTLNPENPLQIDFIIDRGDDALEGEALRGESQKLLSYFYASMTVPEDEMWVNLSPYEENRIIADGLGTTVLGQDMLAQDYMLKQLSASIAYPEDEMGQQFWKRIRTKVMEEYGEAEIPMNTFNKIWIVPETAAIYVHETSVFVIENYLKVMLEEDYLALEHNSGSKSSGDPITGVTNEIVREILIPEIEYEVNYGRNFAPLRQMFHSMILATWYKQNLKSSLLTQMIANQNKTEGVNVDDPAVIQKIYDQYVEAFKVGVYDYIREEIDPLSNEMIPRKYFSGGVAVNDLAMVEKDPPASWMQARRNENMAMVSTEALLQFNAAGSDGKILSLEEALRLNPLNVATLRQARSQQIPMEAIRRYLNDLGFWITQLTPETNPAQEMQNYIEAYRAIVDSAMVNPTRDEILGLVDPNAPLDLDLRELGEIDIAPIQSAWGKQKELYEQVKEALNDIPGRVAKLNLVVDPRGEVNSFNLGERVSEEQLAEDAVVISALGSKDADAIQIKLFNIVQNNLLENAAKDLLVETLTGMNQIALMSENERVNIDKFLEPSFVEEVSAQGVQMGEKQRYSIYLVFDNQGVFQRLQSNEEANDGEFIISTIVNLNPGLNEGFLSTFGSENLVRMAGNKTVSDTFRQFNRLVGDNRKNDAAMTAAQALSLMEGFGSIELMDLDRILKDELYDQVVAAGQATFIYDIGKGEVSKTITNTGDVVKIVDDMVDASVNVNFSPRRSFSLEISSDGNFRAIANESVPNDSAMTQTPGGIDFNANNLNLIGQGEPIQFAFPDIGMIPADITGILPVILNISPITNLPMLLGLNREEDLEEISRL